MPKGLPFKPDIFVFVCKLQNFHCSPFRPSARDAAVKAMGSLSFFNDSKNKYTYPLPEFQVQFKKRFHSICAKYELFYKKSQESDVIHLVLLFLHHCHHNSDFLFQGCMASRKSSGWPSAAPLFERGFHPLDDAKASTLFKFI
jgi:hypothetical protein